MLTRTTTQLLECLRDPANAEMWSAFDDRYRPVLIAFARRQGLSEEDAADVAQTTFTQFADDYRAGRYDRTRGRLSAWIIGIARHRIADAGRAVRRRRADRGDSAFDSLADEDRNDWEEAVRKVVLDRAMAMLHSSTQLDPRTIRAFDLCAVRGVPAAAAAAECGMSVPEVYVAKNRAIKKLRELVAHISTEFADE